MTFFPEDPLITKHKVAPNHQCNWRLLRQTPVLPMELRRRGNYLVLCFIVGYFTDNKLIHDTIRLKHL